MSRKTFDVIESTSELCLRVYGYNQAELFRHALKAMFVSVEPRYDETSPKTSHQIVIKAADQESLLIDFLSESLALSDIHAEAYEEVHFLEISEQNLVAELVGRKIVSFGCEIKAVTYHDVHIKPYQDGLVVDIVLDI